MNTEKLTKKNKLVVIGVILFCNSFSMALAAEGDNKKVTQIVSFEHILNWALGLVVVLLIFFACVWIMRKMGGFSITSKQNMRIISAVSLGVREKLVLVQVGNKQLVLAIMPGKIDKLLVLEGDDQLLMDEAEKQASSDFLLHTKGMKGSLNE